MLKLVIPARELWDETNEIFISTKPVTLQLEHSLLSVSKWESKWHKPFLSKRSTDPEKTNEELLDYIRCMTLTPNVDQSIFHQLSKNEMDQIVKYINDPMTATWFKEDNKKKSKEIITSELIYYWMVALNIPFECQKWHINRLLTLIRVCNEKNKPPKKMSKRELMKRNTALNEQRRARMHSKG